MTENEYNQLIEFCDYKIREGKTKYKYSTNRQEGWNEAFLVMKSKLSREYKQAESEG